MKISIKDIQGADRGEVEVTFAVIANGKGTQAVHDAVVAYRAAQRRGTACTKTMGEVAGSGSKPWRQKGTGRARAGSYASPLWVGGGVVHGPKPRDFRKKLPKAAKRLALRKALSERLHAGDVLIVDDLNLEQPKTRDFVKVLTALDIRGTAVVVSAGPDRNLYLASRNVPGVELTTSDSLNTYQVLRPDRLLFTRGAFEKIGQRLSRET